MPGCSAAFEHHGAGAIGKQHRGPTIGPIGDPRHGLGAHDQRMPRFAGLDELVGHRERIDEATARRLDAEGRAARAAQSLLQQHAAVGKDADPASTVANTIRSISVGCKARSRDGGARGGFGQIDGALVCRRRYAAARCRYVPVSRHRWYPSSVRGPDWSGPFRASSYRCRRFANTSTPLSNKSLRDLRAEVATAQCSGQFHRPRKGRGISLAVAFYHDAAKAHHARAVIAPRIQSLCEAPQGAAAQPRRDADCQPVANSAGCGCSPCVPSLPWFSAPHCP